MDLEKHLLLRQPGICLTGSLQEEPSLVLSVVMRVFMHEARAESSLQCPHKLNFDTLFSYFLDDAFEVLPLRQLDAQQVYRQLNQHIS